MSVNVETNAQSSQLRRLALYDQGQVQVFFHTRTACHGE
jgi:hypothetical protein